MKLLFNIALILFIGQCLAQKTNEYGLKVISDVKAYQRHIQENPHLQLENLADIEGLFFDIKYATNQNFTKTQVYDTAQAFAVKQVAKNLQLANQKFNERGLAIKVFDAYRPYSATVKFYELIKDTQFVASPFAGSRHNRGCAIDITLVDMETGEELPMPTPYDDFTEKAHPNFNQLPKNLITNRNYLIETMQQFGFKVYPTEWWHFDFMGWENYPLLDIGFKELNTIK